MPKEIIDAFKAEYPKHAQQLFNGLETWDGYPLALGAWIDWNWEALQNGATVTL